MSESLIILHEDADCLAVLKPAGQFTQGTWAPAGELTLEQAVRMYLDPLRPESAYLGMVHRLDRPTSGVLLWAKTLKAARRLSSQFERRQVAKQYWAIVESRRPLGDGSQASDPGPETWSDWLTRADRSGVVHVAAPGTPGARQALTTVEFARAEGLPQGCHWLRLWPQTGRTHQLRVQAAERGLPILGDATYGSTSEIFAPEPVVALHARSLELRHPILHHPMTILAPVPAFWGERGLHLPEAIVPSG